MIILKWLRRQKIVANCRYYDRGICQIGIANVCPYRHGCNKPRNKEDK